MMMMPSTRPTIVAVLILLGAWSEARAQGFEPFTLRGARLLQPDGTLADGMAVVVAGGVIVRVTQASEESLPNVHELPAGSVLSPGLIDLASSIGAHGECCSKFRAIASARS